MAHKRLIWRQPYGRLTESYDWLPGIRGTTRDLNYHNEVNRMGYQPHAARLHVIFEYALVGVNAHQAL